MPAPATARVAQDQAVTVAAPIDTETALTVASPGDEPALSVRDLSKTFAGTRALDSFSVSIAAGEIHALVGENGSGKSTFIKVLAGYHEPDPGGVAEVGGERLELGSADAAYALGCRFVHQDLGLVEGLSVLDNLFLSAGFPTRLGHIRTRHCLASARADLARLSLDIDPRDKVQDLSPAQRTGVAVARSLKKDPAAPVRLVVFDEPTATLPENEVARLLGIVKSVAAAGVGVLYVTHRLDEIFNLASNVTVLRDGRKVATRPVAGLTRREVVNLLVGSEFEEAQSDAAELSPQGGDTALRVDELGSDTVADVSFCARRGEIVGVAGITGSGRETLLSTIFGAATRDTGRVLVAGQELAPDRPDLAVAAGVAYLPADRKAHGGAMELSARENLVIADLRPLWRWPKVSRGRERAEAAYWFEKLDVRPTKQFDKLLATFSGGNQQKLLLAKWLRIGPSLILLDEPTQGVDVGAKAVIYRHIIESAADGAAVVVSSSDVDEVAALCHRVLIMRDGRLAAELVGDDVVPAKISRAVLGKDVEVSQR